MTVTRSDLAERIADESGLSRRLVAKILNHFTEEITASVLNGERVELRNFGVFSSRVLGERVIRNPRSGKKTHFPGKTSVRFKPGKKFKSI